MHRVFFYAVVVLIISMALFNFSRAADSADVPFEVRFFLTDLNNQPIANAGVRLVLGAESGWQSAGRGTVLKTGADGKHTTRMSTSLRLGTRKRATNFLDSLLAGKETTDEVQVAVEFAYAGQQRLYVTELHRFKKDGTVALGEISVFCRDAVGNFTRKATRNEDGGWLMADLGGLALSSPGCEIAGFLFYPDESDPAHRQWILDCQFKRSPEPVMR
jgi:hypothetical protein